MNSSGGCLCAQVRYRISAPIGPLIYCHCGQCRKAQGGGFAANVPVRKTHFEITRGTNSVTAFRASPNKTRYFCRHCGSAIYSYLDAAKNVRIRAGTLDPGSAISPNAHIFVASKAQWVTIDDGLKQYPEREPREA